MSEKKTFKNPDLTVFNDGSGWKITPEGVTTYSGSHKWFRSKEWDMEVTFTKKVKPEVGGTANLAIGGPYYTVIAVSGDRVWLQDVNDEYVNFVRRFDQLVDVKPWQPA